MSRSLRGVLLWLLMLALPLQGLAGVARLHCAHGGAMPATAPSHEVQRAAGPAVDHAHVHAAAAAVHDGAHAVTVPADSAPEAPDDGSAAASCSACAACCVALALVPQWPQACAPVPGGLAPLPPAAPAASFLTSGPERPPRLARA